MPAPGSLTTRSALVAGVGELIVEFQSPSHRKETGLTPVLDLGFTPFPVYDLWRGERHAPRTTATAGDAIAAVLHDPIGGASCWPRRECCSAKGSGNLGLELVLEVRTTCMWLACRACKSAITFGNLFEACSQAPCYIFLSLQGCDFDQCSARLTTMSAARLPLGVR
jgi:hypothetical protein